MSTNSIAIDAMGGDEGPHPAVEGAAYLSLQKNAPRLLLVGDRAQIEAILEATPHKIGGLDIVHTDESIPMDCSPKAALDALPDASICVAARLVHSGEAQALVSAGNTGAVILACSRTFSRLKGVERCALGAVFPTEQRRGAKDDPFSLILDAGLTVEPTAEDLIGFAIMGAAYAQQIGRNPLPRVGLLSNGSEENKGTRSIREAHQLFRRLHEQVPGVMDFVGNIEGLDIPRGTADVIVTGGFTGNIVLKMLEGVAETMARLGRYAFKQNMMYKAGLTLLSPALKELKAVTDWEQYGGAPILGFDHLCIKAHGRSSKRALKNAMKVANRCVENQLLDVIQDRLTSVHEMRSETK
ncbi:MAG: phosphate acyltransferase PlsX [Deltaproteobacteria bacterium]|nr:phosphate acyltransferase PlsX [Deltaproteobacteria bacterium]